MLNNICIMLHFKDHETTSTKRVDSKDDEYYITEKNYIVALNTQLVRLNSHN